MRTSRFRAAGFGAIVVGVRLANAGSTLTTLWSFSGPDGANPQTGLTADSFGNFYGTTTDDGQSSLGTVFQLSGPTHNNLTTVLNFNTSTGASEAYVPGLGSLIVGPDGNLYGTTRVYGGTSGNGQGTVFELSGVNHQTLTTLVNFSGSNGSNPVDQLSFDVKGNIFGTTYNGGQIPSQFGGYSSAYGTAFELTKSSNYALTTLATFNVSNGAYPASNLLSDTAGNLYGTTTEANLSAVSNVTYSGTVFELSGTAHTTLTTLFAFNGSNGNVPLGNLVSDPAGNLYGTTETGGTYNDGTVFELSGLGHQTFTTLVNFNGSNGADPTAGVLIDAAGDVFGTTSAGGNGYGTVFELSGTSHQSLTTVTAFNGSLAAIPYGSLVADSAGNLYGTTYEGGANGGLSGSVFEISGAGFAVPEPAGLSTLIFAGLFLSRRVRSIARNPGN